MQNKVKKTVKKTETTKGIVEEQANMKIEMKETI
jgi:hypothetical protein